MRVHHVQVCAEMTRRLLFLCMILSGATLSAQIDTNVIIWPDSSHTVLEEGKIRVRVCVAPSGKVTQTAIVLHGTTTVDSELLAIARQQAANYQFSPLPATAKQEDYWTTITINYVLK